MTEPEFKLVSSIPETIRLVRVIKQPPNVTTYIEGVVGIVTEESVTGGVTWLGVQGLHHDGSMACTGWVSSKFCEPVTDPEWVKASEIFVKERKEYEAALEASTIQYRKGFKEIASKFFISEDVLTQIKTELRNLDGRH